MTAESASGDNDADAELDADLIAMQGRWEQKRQVEGKIVEHMELEIDGHVATTYWIENGERAKGRVASFALSRSGSVKVYTAFPPGAGLSGFAFIYRIDGDEFTIVSGLLSNHGSLPELEMRKWKRVPGAGDKGAD